MSPGGRSNDGRQPGTLHGDRLTPSVPATHTKTFVLGKRTSVFSLSLKMNDKVTHQSPSKLLLP